MDSVGNRKLDDTRVPEEDAHRLLARAVELDADRDTLMTLAQLRAVAQEVGISDEAFDQALAESRFTVAMQTVVVRPPRRALWKVIVANAGAAGVTWLGLAGLAGLSRLVGAGWEVRALVDVVALAGGVAIAHRLRARLARVALVGMAASQGALLAIHLVFGIRSAQGAATQFAVLTAGLLGAGAMIAVGRLRDRTTPAAKADLPADADRPVATVGTGPHQSPLRALRLVVT